MKSPLLVVGAARSGTTLVAERLLGAHPDVRYWSEPSFVWRYGNAYKLHDMLRVEDCTRHIRSRIRAAFEDQRRQRPEALLVEKTPANTFRMPFVLYVLPEARVLHVVRDGRQSTRSAREEWAGLGGSALDSAKIRQKSMFFRLASMIRRDLRLRERYVGPLSPLELPAYGPRAFSFLMRQMFHVSLLPWGARFPGMMRARRQLGLLEVAALQWHLSVQLTRSACAHLGPNQYREVTFERLQAEPESTLRAIREFSGLSPDANWLDRCLELLEPRPVDPAVGLTRNEIARVEAMIGTTLQELGYPLLVRSPSNEPATGCFEA